MPINQTIIQDRANPFTIHITHVPTGESLRFEPYLDSFSDNYKSEWKSETVLGRMDSISTFTRTSRVISLDFTVVSSTLDDACHRYQQSKKLSNFLYPVYKTIKLAKSNKNVVNPLPQKNLKATVNNFYNASSLATTLEEGLSLRDGANIMSAPPILKIKFSNLIQEEGGSDGLYGYVDGFNFTPNINLGYFLDEKNNLIIPKSYKISLTFNVIHVKPRGWKTNNKLR